MAKQRWPDVLRAKVRKDGVASGVELGARLGVAQSTASRWLSGAGYPSGSNLGVVATYLGMDEGRLVALVHEARQHRANVQRLVDQGEMIRTPMTAAVLDELVRLLGRQLESDDPELVAGARRALLGLADGIEYSESERAEELRRLAGP